MRGSTETVTTKKMVEIEVGVTEVTLVMTEAQANIIRSLTGKMGPKQIEYILGDYTGTYDLNSYSVEETIEVIYEFYNVLYETT